MRASVDDGEAKRDIRRNIEKRRYRFAVAVTAFCQYHDVDYGASGKVFNQLVRIIGAIVSKTRRSMDSNRRQGRSTPNSKLPTHNS